MVVGRLISLAVLAVWLVSMASPGVAIGTEVRRTPCTSRCHSEGPSRAAGRLVSDIDSLLSTLRRGSAESESRREAFGAMLSSMGGGSVRGIPLPPGGSVGGRGGGGNGGGVSGNFSGKGLGPRDKNAAAIARAGRQEGASHRDIVTAIAASIVESGLRNVNGGDRDSTGLFQQRNAWGSFAQRMNPTQSAKMFFRGGHGGQQGLLDIGGRKRRGIGSLAQDVQVSAYPGRYAQHVGEARKILNRISRRR